MRVIYYNKIRKSLQSILKTNDVMIVLKDNAYGFGIEEMVNLCVNLGVYNFAVKDIFEGIEVRNLCECANILVLGKCRNIKILKKYDLIGTINDYDDYILFKENKIRAHLGIDLGMNRFGMKSGYLALINDPIIEAIYTHIYKEENAIEKIEFIEDLAKRYNKKCHIGGSIAYKKTKGMLRMGRMIYEYSTELYKEVVNIKRLSKNESVGYDSMYVAKDNEIIAVCNFGYAEGLNLYYSGDVFINNKMYPVIGRCCMDQCFIKVDEDVKMGDIVEFYGDNISEDYFCKKNIMTKYELFLQIK